MIPALTPARAAEMAKGAFGVRPVPEDLDDTVRMLARAGQDGPAFLLTDGAEQYLLTDPHPAGWPRPCRRIIRRAGGAWRRRCSASC